MFVVDVAAAEHARLQILVLAIAAVESVSVEGVICLDGTNPGVSPIDVLSHQASILAALVVSVVHLGRLAMQFSVYLLLGLRRTLLLIVGALSLRNIVVRA